MTILLSFQMKSVRLLYDFEIWISFLFRKSHGRIVTDPIIGRVRTIEDKIPKLLRRFAIQFI